MLDVIVKYADFKCNNTTIDSRSGKNIKEHIKLLWISRFMAVNNIVSRTQTGKLMLSLAKGKIISCQVAFHLGQLSRDFSSGRHHEEDMLNSDETLFVIHLHTKNFLSYRGQQEIKYAEIVSGIDGITLLVTLSGGSDAKMEPSFMILKNDKRSFTIRNVKDNIPKITYRSRPKTWVNSNIFFKWLIEIRN